MLLLWIQPLLTKKERWELILFTKRRKILFWLYQSTFIPVIYASATLKNSWPRENIKKLSEMLATSNGFNFKWQFEDERLNSMSPIILKLCSNRTGSALLVSLRKEDLMNTACADLAIPLKSLEIQKDFIFVFLVRKHLRSPIGMWKFLL